MNSLAARLPWWGKLLAKAALTRLPVDYGVWAHLGLFRHGAMDNPAYAYGVFRQHFQRAQAIVPLKDYVGLELGPGDSLSSAVIAAAFGSSRYYLVDAGAFAHSDIDSYRRIGSYLSGQGLLAPLLNGATSMDEVLASCYAQYLTRGLESVRVIPSGSVDFIWSHVVLQSIRRAEFADYLQECRRILRPTGVCSHRVDLSDLMASSLNNLRFSNRMWESKLVATSGYYSNRIRFGEMLSLFQAAGFSVTVTNTTRWDLLSIKRSQMSPPFHNHPENDLLVSGVRCRAQTGVNAACFNFTRSCVLHIMPRRLFIVAPTLFARRLQLVRAVPTPVMT